MVTGSGESTTRMINMQMDNGDVKVTEVMAEHLEKHGYIDPNLQILVDFEDWKATRPVAELLKEKGPRVAIVDQEELEELVQEREEQRVRIEKIRGTHKRLQEEHQSLVSEQKKLYNQLQNVADTEEKWRTIVEETSEKEKQGMREKMLAEQEHKISQLQAQWLEALAKEESSAATEGSAGLDSKYQVMLAQQLEEEKAALRLQLEQEQSEKLQSLETLLEENKELRAHIELSGSGNALEVETKWKTLLEEAESTRSKELEEKDNKLQEAVATLDATLQEKEALRLKLEEAEVSWNATIGEVERKVHEEKEDIERQMEERLKITAETVAVELGEALQGRLEEMNEANNTTVTELEKDALRAQLNQEKEEELVEVETTWKATLHQVEEKAQKEKDDIQVLLGEGETLKQKVEEIEIEKQSTLSKLEEEGQVKLAEVEAKWQEIFREATGKAVHVGTVDDAKAVIAELEAGWSAKMEEREREHGDILRKMEDDHLSEKNAADAKFLEQEKMVNEMLGKLQKLESREVDVRQSFNTSAAKVESQLRPLRQREVCTGSRDAVLSCYSEHSSQPLRCSEAVKKFMQCVDVERIALLQRNAASS